MAVETWLAFAAASIIPLVIPGPTILTALYAIFAASARRLLSSPTAQRRFNLTGGGLLTGAGIWALLAKRNGVGG